ncbi:uncharacterized protein [Rutidosis leptorrhynchoides]|uniref:uncharacterized protein n=1 Tax=Rutidosis leptorrhynchoides TaxID=125765 RepID=UPI003A993ED0
MIVTSSIAAMFNRRGVSHDVEALYYKVIALCVIFCLLTFGPCTMTGTHNLTGYDEYGSFGNDLSPVSGNLENVCKRSDSFCFPSTLSSLYSNFHNEEESENTILNGNGVSCSFEVKESVLETSDCSNENDTSFVRVKSSNMNDFSSLNVQISHPLLDWGQKYLHFRSLAYLTVENRHKSSDLTIFKPYSTNTHFYSCNNSEVYKVGPGEKASLCFVFLPQWLGSSAGHLILQTSLGGFLVQVKGFAVDPPYMIQTSVGSSPRLLSVFNPSDKVLYLKEASVWLSFSFGNVSYLVKGVCNAIDETVSSNVKDRLSVKIGQLGQPVMSIRPLDTWTVGSNCNEPILELEFPYRSQKNVHGTFSVKLLNNASRDKLDTIVIEEFGGKLLNYDLETRISAFVSVLKPCDADGTTHVSISVDNNGPDVLTVFKINEVGESKRCLQTKYIEGLILFPYTVTQVATVIYTPSLYINTNCKLVVQTNKSDAPALEVSCSVITRFCSPMRSYAGFAKTDLKTGDESVLGNWRSQGSKTEMSVLDDQEVIFPIVHVGGHQSKWVKVVNPSDRPVIMQLLLHSGEIINECRGSDEILQPTSSYNLVLNNHMTPLRYGFSIAQNALTEVYVHPHETAVLGPVVFHPSNCCTWISSALVRNNLSGVEWLSLRGSGGSVSLILLDRAGPVRTVKVKHNYDKPIMKVLFAKNTGDLTVKVNRITVSGTKCELYGFSVSNSKGFMLQPNESRRIIISYRSDICEETVRRDLELDTVGGILVVPLEVNVSSQTLSNCKRLLFWKKLQKLVFAVLVSLFMIFIMCSCTVSFTIRSGKLSQIHSSVVGLKPGPVTSSLTSSLTLTDTVVEATKPESLTVKTGKDKARRRKKKKNSGLGLSGLYEVSSSHSSNSTPSSPLTPILKTSPSKSVRAKSPINDVSTSVDLRPKETHCTRPKQTPCTRPEIKTPSARAERNVKNAGGGDRFKYNILDYHLQLHRPGSSEVGPVMPTETEGNKFSSFFERSPEELFRPSQADNVSSTQVDE